MQKLINLTQNAVGAKPTRQLGKNGPQVAALGFGAMGLSMFYGKPKPDDERFALLDRAYEIGATNWDTADMYGDNEDLIGQWFKRTGKRNEIFLATKFANTRDKDGKPVIRDEPEYVHEACKKCLQRLGIDQIDLYYCHRFSGKVPVEDVVGAMADLVKQGKIKYIGLSECSASTLRRAHAVHPITAVQLEYSPFTLDVEQPATDLLKTARELGVALVAYSPLGRGFLTGRYKSPDDFEDGDFRKVAPRFSAENFPRNLELLDELKRIAERKGVSTGQLSLAWLLKQGPEVVPIPGTTQVRYLEENWAALKVSLSDEEEREIRKYVEKAEVHGARYPAFAAAALFRDTPPKK